jgi:hypothetical protein
MRPALLAALALWAALVAPAWADSGILPDPSLTPGAVRTTDVGEICSHGTRELRRWSRERDDRIMLEHNLWLSREVWMLRTYGNHPPEPWTAEHESNVPAPFQLGEEGAQ